MFGNTKDTLYVGLALPNVLKNPNLKQNPKMCSYHILF